jgi:glycosyltransferase involved in cell wall biosynthesis
MKVLHVTWNVGQGGAQVYLLGLLKELSKYPDLELSVLVLNSQGSLTPILDKTCNDVTYLSMGGASDIFGVIRLMRYLNNMKVDVVHYHFPNTALHILMHFIRVPIVYTEHGGGLLAGRLAVKLLYKYFTTPINRFIAISDYMASVMVSENHNIQKRVLTIHNGISIEEIEAMSPANKKQIPGLSGNAAYIVGIVGRLVYQKGIEYFIHTAKDILDKRNEISFVIVGSGEDEEKLKEMTQAMGISDHVIFMGYQKDAIRYMKLFDVLLFTSRFEPFGLVLTEAMTANVPIVAMDIRGAVSEIIRSGKDGVVINGSDCKSAAEAVIQLLDDKDYRKRLIDNAKARVMNKYTIEENAKKVYDVYNELIT